LTASCQIPDALPSGRGDFYLDGDLQSPGQSVDSRGQAAFGQDCGWMPREISWARPALATLRGALVSGRLADNADHDDGFVRGRLGRR
jgi:hypothetical protein